MNNINSHVQKEYILLFKKFKEIQYTLPYEIKWKLNQIIKAIEGHTFKINTFSTQQIMQLQDLKGVNQQSLMFIFNSIVQTLVSQNFLQNRKCKIKRKGFFSSWKQSYINCCQDTINFNVQCKNIKLLYKQLEIRNKQIKKNIFEIYINKKYEMKVKMSQKENYELLLRKIEEQKLNKKTKTIIESQKNQQIQFLQLKKIKQINQKNNSQQIILNKNKLLNEEQNELHQISKNIPTITNSLESFILYKQTNNIAIWINQPNSMLQIILKTKIKDPICRVMSCLSSQKIWNTSLIKQESIEILKGRKFQTHRIYKAFGVLSNLREVYTQIQMLIQNEDIYWIEQKSIDKKQKIKSQYIQSYLKSITRFNPTKDGYKIIIQVNFDGKGYYNSKDNCKMLIQMYKSIQFLQNCYTIWQNQKQKYTILFEQKSLSSQQKSLSSQQKLIQFESNNNNNNNKISINQLNMLSINQIKLITYQSIPNQNRFIAIKNNLYQKFYLKHKINQDVLKQYSDEIPPYCLSQMIKRGGQYIITQNKQLHFINMEQIQSQKDTLKYMIKQIGSNLFSGKSILNISLPVDIFQSRSLLERSAAQLGYAPDYLMPICQSQPIEQMKNIFYFFVSVPALELVMEKPFNPIIGETFQGYIRGIPIYEEQISHHPPISSYYMKCPQFILYGNLHAYADVGLNSAIGGNSSPLHIILKNGFQYECYFSPCQISGLIYGTRKFRAYGRGYILERSTRLFCEISIEKSKKDVYEFKKISKPRPGDIIGGIYRVNQTFVNFFTYNEKNRKFPGLSKEHIEEKLAHIEGVWFQTIMIDEKCLSNGEKAYPVQYVDYPLPSDSNWRLDLMYRKKKNLIQSQQQKQILENQQRKDKKIRQNAQKRKFSK